MQPVACSSLWLLCFVLFFPVVFLTDTLSENAEMFVLQMYFLINNAKLTATLHFLQLLNNKSQLALIQPKFLM